MKIEMNLNELYVVADALAQLTSYINYETLGADKSTQKAITTIKEKIGQAIVEKAIIEPEMKKKKIPVKQRKKQKSALLKGFKQLRNAMVSWAEVYDKFWELCPNYDVIVRLNYLLRNKNLEEVKL